MKRNKRSIIDEFVSLPDEEKERVYNKIDAEPPRRTLALSRPLNRSERAQWSRFKSKMGRPTVGAGAKTISLTVEKSLLRRADAYAKKHGISRAKLVAQGLESIVGNAGSGTRGVKAK